MAKRFRSALIGFLVCAIILCAFFASLYFAAPYRAEIHVAELTADDFSEAEARAFLIKSSQWVATEFTQFMLVSMAIYWFICGVFCKEVFLRIGFANMLLFFGSVGLVIGTVNQYFWWIDTYCHVVAFPRQGFQISKIYECPSSEIFFSSLFYFSILLFLVSLIVRIIQSRKAMKASLTRND